MSTADKDHYTLNRADAYATHHEKSARTRLTTRRERSLLARALRAAGTPQVVLDLPCGTGRFWPAVAASGAQRLIAGDNSAGMLEVAGRNALGPGFPEQLINTSLFAIDLADDSVDFVACMRFFQHLAYSEDRLAVLAEIKRVSRRFAAISLWVDGNLGAWRRRGRSLPTRERGYGKRVCIPRDQIESDFAAADFTVVDHFDVWPRLAMWRMYLIECR
ncbi:MAG: class I SAM-dependent methyltransferase [Gammaproteobacteria bacterium]|nr:class I SAM-dependent methyltransferase [Gammaproteobacteria bacterium]